MNRNKKKQLIIYVTGAFVILILVTCLTFALRSCQQRSTEDNQEQTQQEQTQTTEESNNSESKTDNSDVLNTLISNIWESEDGKATLAFKDGRYIESTSDSTNLVTFDVKETKKQGSGYALFLKLDATQTTDAKESLVTISYDSKDIEQVSSDDFKFAKTYKLSSKSRETIVVEGKNIDALYELINGNDKKLEQAIETYAAKKIPSAKKAVWTGEVLLDYNSNYVTTTFTCDDNAKTHLTVTYEQNGNFTVSG